MTTPEHLATMRRQRAERREMARLESSNATLRTELANAEAMPGPTVTEVIEGMRKRALAILAEKPRNNE